MSTPAKQQSKFFRIGVEGATTDGRRIERDWLVQMAAQYSRSTYGARVNMEHYKGVLPDGPFRAYGDVIALKAEEIEIGGQKKMALFAQIEPTADLIDITKKRQKIYTSMEVNPRFADTGKAYLVGLAVTDNPASLGTEALEFAASKPAANPWAARKADKDNLVTEAEEVTLEFEDAAEEGAIAKFSSAIKGALAKFNAKSSTDDARFAAVAEGFEQLGEAFAAHVTATSEKLTANAKTIGELQSQLKDLQGKYAALDTTATGTQRPLAAGGNGTVLTDC